jgi:hypothetical protein
MAAARSIGDDLDPSFICHGDTARGTAKLAVPRRTKANGPGAMIALPVP